MKLLIVKPSKLLHNFRNISEWDFFGKLCQTFSIINGHNSG